MEVDEYIEEVLLDKLPKDEKERILEMIDDLKDYNGGIIENPNRLALELILKGWTKNSNNSLNNVYFKKTE